MNEKKKKVFIIIAIIAALAVACSIYWKATEHHRYIKRYIDNVREEISDYRSGEDTDIEFSATVSVSEDPTYTNFLSRQVPKMINKAEYNLLGEFLEQLEDEYIYIYEIRSEVTRWFNNVGDLEAALEIEDKLKDDGYYDSALDLSRYSSLATAYIESNGIEEISITPGTGYYANEKDISDHKRIGIPGSPLYDALKISYLGDFEERYEYGVELNYYYKETQYSQVSYSFRGNPLSFSPYDGECIYSGDYLFCFSSDGTLIGADKITEQ